MKNLFRCMLVLLLFGCETIRLAEETRYVDAAIKSGEAAEVITSVDMTAIEFSRLTNGLNAYNTFRNKWKGFADKPIEKLEENIPELKTDLENLDDHFKNIQADVTKNWHKYSIENQTILLEYESHVNRLILATKRHYRYEHYIGMLQTSLEYAKFATKIAITAGVMI